MSQKKRIELKFKKRAKRKKRRGKLAKSGKNPDDFFQSGIYVSGRLK